MNQSSSRDMQELRTTSGFPLTLISLWKVALLSLLVLVVSIFIELSSATIGPVIVGPAISVILQFGIPIFLGFLFIFFAKRAIDTLENERSGDGLSEAEITRIIEKYTGFVDGIGTAMPLIGAAILLYTIGYEFENDETRKLAFSGFAVPFEIKAILILASAKLFESVFDEIALKYQVAIRSDDYSVGTLPSSIAGISASLDSRNVENLSAIIDQLRTNPGQIRQSAEKLTELTNSLNASLSAMQNESVKQNIDSLRQFVESLKK